MTEKQRALRAGTVLGEIVDATVGDPVILGNIELLFDCSLQQDPLRVLKDLSRDRTGVASWNGAISENGITYAVPGHPEYRRYRTIVTVAKRIPEDVLQEDAKLLMWYDQAVTRLGEE